MLTPQEVSSHVFTKSVMGGYNMAMVDEFLDELTDDYTALYKENAQIDMVIERSDKVIDLCEIKFTDRPYALSKREAELLSNRAEVLIHSLKSRRTIEIVLISNQNAMRNMHYNSLINKNITLDDLINI